MCRSRSSRNVSSTPSLTSITTYHVSPRCTHMSNQPVTSRLPRFTVNGVVRSHSRSMYESKVSFHGRLPILSVLPQLPPHEPAEHRHRARQVCLGPVLGTRVI